MFVVYGVLSFFTILFLTAYEQGIKIDKRLSNVFQIMGDASYGIYLFGPIITIIIGPEDLYHKFMIIIATVVFSTVFNQAIENKFLMLVRKKLYARFPKTEYA
jgi:peptidoglycan/LPS O-acetylase OafA/YrhL